MSWDYRRYWAITAMATWTPDDVVRKYNFTSSNARAIDAWLIERERDAWLSAPYGDPPAEFAEFRRTALAEIVAAALTAEEGAP